MHFVDAEPVKSTSPGRTAEPNPYAEIIGLIALKTKDDGKTPVAKAFTLEHSADEAEKKTAHNKATRLLRDAGKNNDPKVTVNVRIAPVKNPVNGQESKTKSVVTFWTQSYVSRPRKPAETPAPVEGAQTATAPTE